MATGFQEMLDGHEGSGLAHIVGLGFEGQPPNGNGLALQVACVILVELSEENGLLLFVDIFNGFQDTHAVAVLFSRLDEGFDVFRETRTAIAATGIEELRTDAGIAADALTHHVDIRSNEFAEIGNVVHERNARGEHGIGRIFDHLRRRDVREDHAEVVEHEGRIEARHQIACPLALNADNNAVGRHEVFDGSSFLKKFGIGSHVKRNVLAALLEFFLNGRLHLV